MMNVVLHIKISDNKVPLIFHVHVPLMSWADIWFANWSLSDPWTEWNICMSYRKQKKYIGVEDIVVTNTENRISKPRSNFNWYLCLRYTNTFGKGMNHISLYSNYQKSLQNSFHWHVMGFNKEKSGCMNIWTSHSLIKSIIS